MEYHLENQQVIVNLGDRLDKESINEQKEIFLKILSLKLPIILNAQDASRLDVVGMQLLLGFILTATKNDLVWQWQDEPNNVFTQFAKMLGMHELLRLSDNKVPS